MPVHVVEKLNKILRSERKLRGELCREPAALESALDHYLPIEEIEYIVRSAQTPPATSAAAPASRSRLPRRSLSRTGVSLGQRNRPPWRAVSQIIDA